MNIVYNFPNMNEDEYRPDDTPCYKCERFDAPINCMPCKAGFYSYKLHGDDCPWFRYQEDKEV